MNDRATYDPTWAWNPAAAHHFAIRSMLEYEDDPSESIHSLDISGTDRVDFMRNTDSGVDVSVTTLYGFHIVTFRGTEPKVLKDWMSDLRIRRRPLDRAPGKVHRGFMDGVDTVYSWLIDKVGDGLPVIVTGHSKGAGEATAFAARALAETVTGGPINVAGGITFGSPRTLGKEMADWFEAGYGCRWWRCVNGCDVVTRVPFSSPFKAFGGYKHVGRLAYLDHEDGVCLDPGRWLVFKDRVKGRWEALAGDTPSVAEVPGLAMDIQDKLAEAGLHSLMEVAGSSLIELGSKVGSGPARLVLSWAVARLAGVDTSELDAGAALFDGTQDHSIVKGYVHNLRNLSFGELTLPIPDFMSV